MYFKRIFTMNLFVDYFKNWSQQDLKILKALLNNKNTSNVSNAKLIPEHIQFKLSTCLQLAINDSNSCSIARLMNFLQQQQQQQCRSKCLWQPKSASSYAAKCHSGNGSCQCSCPRRPSASQKQIPVHMPIPRWQPRSRRRQIDDVLGAVDASSGSDDCRWRLLRINNRWHTLKCRCGQSARLQLSLQAAGAATAAAGARQNGVPAAVATPLYSKLRLCACPRALHIAAKSAEHVWSASECVCVCVWCCNIIHQAASRASAGLSQLVIAAGETGTRPWAPFSPSCPFCCPCARHCHCPFTRSSASLPGPLVLNHIRNALDFLRQLWQLLLFDVLQKVCNWYVPRAARGMQSALAAAVKMPPRPLPKVKIEGQV